MQENNFLLPAPLKQQKVYGKKIEWTRGPMLGSGTTGEVYEAMDINDCKTFVVKQIHLVHSIRGVDQQKVKSVKKEIDRYKKLKHKHIVEYYGSEIIEQNIFCIYLEWVEGGSIAQMCKSYGKIHEQLCRTYTMQVLKALAYLHENAIVHGDLKGANVLLTIEGNQIKLCDMGSSIQFNADASVCSIASLTGSLQWMAPEAHQQKLSTKSDIWSLGCLVIEMVTGSNPWGNCLNGEVSAVLALQRKLANQESPEIPADVSPECQQFIRRCLHYSYRERPSAKQLLADPWMRAHSKLM